MIKIENLQKSFKGNKVIDNLSLEINSGEITALVGKNGAGKSTLIRLISGIYKPDSGKIYIDGSSEKDIGVLLGGDVSLYSNLTAFEIIDFFSKLHHIDSKTLNIRIDELDKILSFKSFLNKKAKTLSRGMRQKIALTISIIHNPGILLLDEPSTGLDLEAANDVINFLKFLKQKEKTILIATHNIYEISDLSDCIAFMNGGKIQGKVETEAFFKSREEVDKSKLIIDAMGEK